MGWVPCRGEWGFHMRILGFRETAFGNLPGHVTGSLHFGPNLCNPPLSLSLFPMFRWYCWLPGELKAEGIEKLWIRKMYVLVFGRNYFYLEFLLRVNKYGAKKWTSWRDQFHGIYSGQMESVGGLFSARAPCASPLRLELLSHPWPHLVPSADPKGRTSGALLWIRIRDFCDLEKKAFAPIRNSGISGNSYPFALVHIHGEFRDFWKFVPIRTHSGANGCQILLWIWNGTFSGTFGHRIPRRTLVSLMARILSRSHSGPVKFWLWNLA